MFWPDTQTGVDVEPARKSVQSAVRKYFTEGGVGVPPTVPGGDWFNQITNELLNVLAAAGISPDKLTDDQLAEAIAVISNSAINDHIGNWLADHLLLADFLTLDGVTDDTNALNLLTKSAIDNSKSVDLGSGGWTARCLNAFLNDYTIGQAVSGDEQREHVKSFVGRGGKYFSPVFMATDDATSDDYVLIGNNSVGVKIGGFRVSGNGLSKGADFSFIGPAGGVAPSNGSEIHDIWCENFVGVGLDLSQCNDTDIHGIFTRNGGTTTTSEAVRLIGDGGFMAMRDSVIYGGRVNLACQNGRLSNVVLSGLELSGSSYNNVELDACHFIATETYAINSTAIGNATQSIKLDACYFPTDMGDNGYIQGLFHRGGVITNTRFTSGVITSNIAAASGTGAKPIFFFYNCQFETTPVFDTTNSIAVCVNCTGPTGSPFNYQSEAIHGYSWLHWLSIGGTEKDSTESFSNTAAGWTRIAANVSGVDPQNAFGVYLGWNKSSGRGEVAFAYNKGAGSTAGIDFADTSTGTYNVQWQMKNASFGPANDNTQSAATSALRYSVVFAGTSTISTSDESEKTFCDSELSDAVLDVWATLNWRAYKFNDAILAKGSDSARIHFGMGAQTIFAAFAAAGLDATRYALFCHDEWDAEYEPVMIDSGNTDAAGVPIMVDSGETRCVLEAGSRYGLRYEECLVLEAALMRRTTERLNARISELES